MSDTLQDLERDTDLNQKKTMVTVTATALPASPWVAFAMTADYLEGPAAVDEFFTVVDTRLTRAPWEEED